MEDNFQIDVNVPKELNVNDVKKYLYKNKELMAKYIFYKHGNLYYSVQLEDGLYKFPISTVDESTSNSASIIDKFQSKGVYNLSADLGETPFDNEIKASLLNRWIGKAFENGNFEKMFEQK